MDKIRLDFEFTASPSALKGLIDSLLDSDAGRAAVLRSLANDFEEDLFDFLRQEYSSKIFEEDE
jgi:hypothetical protein